MQFRQSIRCLRSGRKDVEKGVRKERTSACHGSARCRCGSRRGRAPKQKTSTRWTRVSAAEGVATGIGGVFCKTKPRASLAPSGRRSSRSASTSTAPSGSTTASITLPRSSRSWRKTKLCLYGTLIAVQRKAQRRALCVCVFVTPISVCSVSLTGRAAGES